MLTINDQALYLVTLTVRKNDHVNSFAKATNFPVKFVVPNQIFLAMSLETRLYITLLCNMLQSNYVFPSQTVGKQQTWHLRKVIKFYL